MSVKSDVTELVVEHLPLVGYNVSELLHRVPPSVSRDELASAGALALVLAARAYDPSTNVPFARYASLRIKGALLDELRSMDWATRGTRRRGRELDAATERLRTELGRTPTRSELAQTLGVTVSAVDATRADAERRVMSLDVPGVDAADGVRDEARTPEEHVLAAERTHWLHAAVQELPERLQGVIAGLYLEDRSIADLATELGVTQSRISQLRTEGLALLRDGLNSAFDPDLLAEAERPEGVAERRRQAYYAAVASRAALSSLPTQRTSPEARVLHWHTA
ncbi:sigma-70 family RNA polymerase sigma factor [Cellulomonas wangsupingiae]|uniref:Sigma-70 family RNA polymerase sigma factor n=1 Tax=Cellulomonas wangsupingiae TaxID=2968085 RepID=A0ABY5K5U8_9CELL|nr:sigma-70 family RNA polymerase sigma factor [Cellulomonas wangsupingiae]MCC2334142.1 sigma-70 family RNA polymerase sigma factor [Cellulomonas wangsupingiae]UUI65822.1 sigma-70 family RNA polymerase sigma factor [Cellulomonas wangsupingiae]